VAVAGAARIVNVVVLFHGVLLEHHRACPVPTL
jgi:hypothetical protein